MPELAVADRFHLFSTHRFNILREKLFDLLVEVCGIIFEFSMLGDVKYKMLLEFVKLACKCSWFEMLLAISECGCEVFGSFVNLFKLDYLLLHKSYFFI